MPRVPVLDASALLALLQDEPGASAVVEAIKAGAAISMVNFLQGAGQALGDPRMPRAGRPL